MYLNDIHKLVATPQFYKKYLKERSTKHDDFLVKAKNIVLQKSKFQIGSPKSKKLGQCAKIFTEISTIINLY